MKSRSRGCTLGPCGLWSGRTCSGLSGPCPGPFPGRSPGPLSGLTDGLSPDGLSEGFEVGRPGRVTVTGLPWFPGLKSGVIDPETSGLTEGLTDGFDGLVTAGLSEAPGFVIGLLTEGFDDEGRETVVLGLRSEDMPDPFAFTVVFLDGLEMDVVPDFDPPGRVWEEGLTAVCLVGVDFFTFELLPAWREVLVAVRDSFLPV